MTSESSRKTESRSHDSGNSWPAESIQTCPLDSLVPFVGNAREHPPEQVRAIARSMLEFGWKSAVLREQIEALKAESFDVSLLGFSAADLRRLKPSSVDENAVPEAEAFTVTRPGDVWILDGRHRLACGSSTERATVEPLLQAMGGEPRHMVMVTDPPYGVNYDPAWRTAVGLAARSTGKVMNDDRFDWTDAWQLFPGSVAYVWHAGIYAGEVQASLSRAGFMTRSQIIWVKNHIAISRGHYHWRHEPCWYAARDTKGGARWTGGRKRDTILEVTGLDGEQADAVIRMVEEVGLESTVWEIGVTGDDMKTGHGTQKPVECMRRPMSNHGGAGDVVYEPFSGSGSSLIAAETIDRRCAAVELNPAYVDIAVRRWQKFTGLEAVRAGDGARFRGLIAEVESATWT